MKEILKEIFEILVLLRTMPNNYLDDKLEKLKKRIDAYSEADLTPREKEAAADNLKEKI